MSDRSPRGADRGPYDGPWSNLPPPEPPARRPREPLLKTRKAAREPWIKNWKAVAVIAFLLLVAPPLCGWLSRLIMGMVQGG